MPNVRVNDEIAFYETRVKYLGPLYCIGIEDMNSLEDDYGLFKCYVVLYTCAWIRGVILELVPDASSKSFGVLESLLLVEVVFTSQETQKFASNRNIN